MYSHNRVYQYNIWMQGRDDACIQFRDPNRKGRDSQEGMISPHIHDREKVGGMEGQDHTIWRLLVLLNVVLSTMPIYLMSVAILPRWFCKRMDKILSKFL